MKKWKPEVELIEVGILDDEYRQRVDEVADTLIEYFSQLQKSEVQSCDNLVSNPKPIPKRTGSDG